MSVAMRIEEKLREDFTPESLTVVDESHLHAGHAGARPQGESHFRVEITSDVFEGLSRVARQRLIYQSLSVEMATNIHALSLTVRSPTDK
ncbi:MAG: BolA family transcriptional regulator [Sneathiella sp.]|nr:BolA family transcriptional regulator [Sneathiella sp.]